MNYPSLIDYHEAVQYLPTAFSDGEIREGRLELSKLGLPLAVSGNFALTYLVHADGKKLAIRCFHKAVPDVEKRYAKISSQLESIDSRYFVDFQFQPSGICVRGRWYPIIKMDWVEGETLSVYLRRTFHEQSSLLRLRRSFRDLSILLEGHGVAHGDLQNENVIVSNGEIRLVDYDGMFVSGMNLGDGSEVGDRHFQHPKRSTKHFGPNMDRFSFLVLDISLHALTHDPSLHPRFCSGGQTIIFKSSDFAAPSTSEIFFLLTKIPALKDDISKLAAVCAAPFEAVPTLVDFVAGRNIPVGEIKLEGPRSGHANHPAKPAYQSKQDLSKASVASGPPATPSAQSTSSVGIAITPTTQTKATAPGPVQRTIRPRPLLLGVIAFCLFVVVLGISQINPVGPPTTTVTGSSVTDANQVTNTEVQSGDGPEKPVAAPPPPKVEEFPATVSGSASVVDSGTIRVGKWNATPDEHATGDQIVHLFGISGSSGEAVKRVQGYIDSADGTLLAGVAFGGRVNCSLVDASSYTCRLGDGRDLAALVLSSGSGRAATNAPEEYRQDEADARMASRGIWGQTQSDGQGGN